MTYCQQLDFIPMMCCKTWTTGLVSTDFAGNVHQCKLIQPFTPLLHHTKLHISLDFDIRALELKATIILVVHASFRNIRAHEPSQIPADDI